MTPLARLLGAGTNVVIFSGTFVLGFAVSANPILGLFLGLGFATAYLMSALVSGGSAVALVAVGAGRHRRVRASWPVRTRASHLDLWMVVTRR